MVKRIAAILAAIMIAAALAACTDPGEIVLTDEPGVVTTAPAQTEEDAFYFNAGKISIRPHGDFANAEQYLGEPVSKEVSASCAYIGYDKVFVYNGFTVQTYPDGDRDFILWISVTDPSKATPEGISIGSTQQQVSDAYGTGYEARGSAWVYTRGNTSLSFMFGSDGKVAAIQYMAE